MDSVWPNSGTVLGFAELAPKEALTSATGKVEGKEEKRSDRLTVMVFHCAFGKISAGKEC